MNKVKRTHKTTVGVINAETLAFTAGRDPELDRRLAVADCIGTAAHAVMLSRMPVRPAIITPAECKKVLRELSAIIPRARKNDFNITLQDQDCHLAIERTLTARLGETGRKIHTGRSRNDQVATALRLHGKEQMLYLAEEALSLCGALLDLAGRHKMTPMVGRTHMQPAMPSSVGLWASAYAEGILEDIELLKGAYLLNDRSPLGSAAGFGVPLPIDRRLASELLGFRGPILNVVHAGNTRGKIESIVLSAAAQLMVTLSRLAQDLIIFTMPEFNYFALPPEMCTGSSIMPQKNNPDILELVRAKAARVCAEAFSALEITRALPSGYNRDLQEIKGPYMDGLDTALASARIMIPMVAGLKVNRAALLQGFRPGVFAADQALFLAGQGVPFRDAYHRVKESLAKLENMDPAEAIRRKKHLGATANLDLGLLSARRAGEEKYFRRERKKYYRSVSRLLGVKYPLK